MAVGSPIDAESHVGKKVLRLRAWHGILLAFFVGLYSYWAVKWVVEWETTRGRVAPAERVTWNAVSIHSGPLAGVYYWDYGYQRPNLFRRTEELVAGGREYRHGVLAGIVFPAVLLLILPSVGIVRRPVSIGVRIAAGAAFVAGVCLWYFSAMVSIAMLS